MEKQHQLPKGCWLRRAVSQLCHVSATGMRALTVSGWVKCGRQGTPACQIAAQMALAEYKVLGIQMTLKEQGPHSSTLQEAVGHQLGHHPSPSVQGASAGRGWVIPPSRRGSRDTAKCKFDNQTPC